MTFGPGMWLLLHCASFFALGSTTLDLLIRPLGVSISEIMDLQLTNQIAVFLQLYSKANIRYTINESHICVDTYYT